MKRMNGTITLSFVEEDNKQRVIFRVVPLCTLDGAAFKDVLEIFPDQGSLRVVPDKREQSTFKERMREMGKLCVIELADSDGKELAKIRPNRNYAPAQGEENQFAIYSDVVQEFAPSGVFEVVEWSDQLPAQETLLTKNILLLLNKVLYGPVSGEELSKVDREALKPFGNDRFLLHTVTLPDATQHSIYWNPEATINWRQRRVDLRRKGDKTAAAKAGGEASQDRKDGRADKAQGTDKAFAKQADKANERVHDRGNGKPAEKANEKVSERISEKIGEKVGEKPSIKANEKIDEKASEKLPENVEEKIEATPEKASDESTIEKKDEKVAELSSAQVAEPNPESAQRKPQRSASVLPIGQKLEILDESVSFDQHISRLDQPVSETANRLTMENASEVHESSQIPARFAGTPLLKDAAHAPRTISRPDPLHHVVEQQMRQNREEHTSAERRNNGMRPVNNPIESMLMAIDEIWQNAETREQAIALLMENQGFAESMLTAFRNKGRDTRAVAAAYAQLEDMEAERLSLLMQIEQAQTAQKAYMEKALATATQKKKEEISRLTREVETLTQEKETIESAIKEITEQEGQTEEQLMELIGKKLSVCEGMTADGSLMLSPVIGTRRGVAEILETIRLTLNAYGFGVTDDEVMILYIAFSMFPVLRLSGKSREDAHLFATAFLQALGLQSVSATVREGTGMRIASILPENEFRSPTVTIQPAGMDVMSAFGHKTILLSTADEPPVATACIVPVFPIPAMSGTQQAEEADAAKLPKPIALSSLLTLTEEAHSLMEEGERWFEELRCHLAENDILIPDALMMRMRRFVAICAAKIRGGFLAAADAAICQWVVPVLLSRQVDAEAVQPILNALPRTLEQISKR